MQSGPLLPLQPDGKPTIPLWYTVLQVDAIYTLCASGYSCSRIHLLHTLFCTPYSHRGGTPYIQQGGKLTSPRGHTVHLPEWYTIPSPLEFFSSVGTSQLYRWISASVGSSLCTHSPTVVPPTSCQVVNLHPGSHHTPAARW